MSALPKFTMRQLLDAGVHYGHKTMRWNPAMAPYIFGERNNIHIIDLQKTVPMLHRALRIAHEIASRNGRILFVSTKRQATDIVAETAKRCGQYYVNHRWLGGMLTNWGTVSKSIKTLRDLQEQLDDEEATISKKERLSISRKVNKLELALGGIKDMGGTPDLVFIIDTNKEHIAVQEANKLGIPVIGIVDTNADPDDVDYAVPGNDDATRSIKLYCDLLSDTILDGLQNSLAGQPQQDAGAQAEPEAEPALDEAKAATVVKKKAKKAATPANDDTAEAPAEEPKAEEAAKEEKKPAAKKAAAKKPAAEKKTAEKKPAAKKAPAKKAAAKKPAAKKAEAKA